MEWASAKQRGGGRLGRWYYWNAMTRESSWAPQAEPQPQADAEEARLPEPPAKDGLSVRKNHAIILSKHTLYGVFSLCA